MSTTTPTAAEAELAIQAREAATAGQGYWAGVWKRLRRDPLTIACAAVLLAMLVVIVFPPGFAPADPYQSSMLRRLRCAATVKAPYSWKLPGSHRSAMFSRAVRKPSW